MKLINSTLLLACAAGMSSASAHHSTAIFDMQTDVVIEGKIVRYEWANPHVYLWLESLSATGEMITWEVEGGPPAILRRSGISPDLIAVGDVITVHGKPGRVALKHQVLMNSLVKADVGSLDFGQANALASIVAEQPTASQVASSVHGTWGSGLDMQVAGSIVNVADALLNDKGRQARQDILQGRLPYEAVCEPAAAPLIMLAPDIKRIVVSDDEVRISREWDGVERIVHMNTASHEGVAPSLQGHSTGRWEGTTLVIDTARFTANARGNGYTLPSSEQKHLIEKLRLSEDGTHLVYSVVLEDAEYLSEPLVSEEVKWMYRPDLEFSPVPCDAENALRYRR